MPPRRKPVPRCPGFDYRADGLYFVTVCTRGREPLLGTLVGGTCLPTNAGRVVLAVWEALPRHYAGVRLDAFVVMPDHVHGLMGLESAEVPLWEIVRALKSFSARRINEARDTPGSRVWQRTFYDRIVRDDRAHAALRAYIAVNPWRTWCRENAL